MIILVVKITILPGSETEFEQGVASYIPQVRQNEPGCLGFQVSRLAEVSRVYFLYEQYADEQALEIHRLAPYFQAFSAEFLPRLMESRERNLCTHLAGELS